MTEAEIKRRASELVRKGRYDEAVAECSRLLESSRTLNPAMLNLIGDLQFKQGESATGLASYLRAADAYAEEGLFHNAVAVVRKVLRLDAHCVEAHAVLGVLLARQGLEMDCVNSLNEYARLQDEAGRFHEVLERFDEAATHLEAFPEFHLAHAGVNLRVDHFAEAAACFRKAAFAQTARGRADLAKEAEALAAKAEADGGDASRRTLPVADPLAPRPLDADTPEPWAAFHAGEHPELPPPPPLSDDAAEPETLAAPPDSPAVRQERGTITGDEVQIIGEDGEVASIVADFRDATLDILDMDDYQSHYDLGMTYLEMELFDEAVSEFELSARGVPFALASQEMLGTCFLRTGNMTVAIREFEKGLEFPGHDERDRLGVLYNLGIAYGVTERESEAIAQFQRILETDPGFRDARARLSRLVGNPE